MTEHPDREPVLHLYPLTTEHGDASVVGNRSALEMLREAIERALNTEDVRIQPFASDGEGYDLTVTVQPGDCHSEEWSGWRAPYFERRKW